jgi:hypothetical protein
MLSLSVTVTNEAPVSLFGLSAFIRVPPEVSAFGTAATTGGAICNKGVSFACDNLEPVRFASLATPAAPLGAGQSVTFTIAAPVPMGAPAPPPGTIISFEVDVVADDGSEVLARPNVRVQ